MAHPFPAVPGTSATGRPVPLRFGPFLLDRAGARLLRDGQPVDVAPRPWQVLCFLAERPGQLVTKDALLDAVWGHRFVSDSVLKVTVNALRRALGEDARAAAWIQTVARRGYRFSDAVQVVGDASPAVPASADAAAAGPAHTTAATVPGQDAGHAAGNPAGELPPPPGNLPPAGPALVGRDAALAGLRSRLGAHRLLTLTGPGGVGKTRLALAVAGHAAPAGGAWLVRLDALERPEDVPGAVARALGLGDAAGASAPALARALATRPLRLVLDSAEHLVGGPGDAAGGLARQVTDWLHAAPQLSLLVTSQRPLRVDGEQLVLVEPLPVPAAGAAAGALADNAAVALVVQRVQGLQPGWVPAASELADCGAIVQALDGMPLALELAAARIPLLGTAGVRQRLDARLQMLTGGRRDGPDRQRSLRAALDWTVGLLPPLALRVLERSAVFAGGFNAEAAQAVAAPALPEADEWAVLDALDLLRDLGLVVMQPAARRGAGDAPHLPAAPRLRLLDSVRLLAAERLAAAADLEPARADHLAWMHGLLASSEDRYFAEGIEHWLAPLEPEADNLVAAADHALARLERDLGLATGSGQGPAPAHAARPAPPAAGTAAAIAQRATGLASLLALSTHVCLRLALGRPLKTWRDRLDACLRHGGITLPPAVQAHWWLGGALLGGQGLVPMAQTRALGEQAVQALRDTGPPGRHMMALYATGLFQQRMGEREAVHATLAAMRRVLVDLAGTGAPADTSAAPVGLRRLEGWLAAAAAQFDGDLAAYERFGTGLLAEAQARGDRFEAWRAAWGVGQARFLRGDTAAAVQVMDAAIDEVRAVGRLHAQLGFASQALLMRLALDADAPTLARLRELVPLLRGAGMLFEALGDALAWVPLHQGRLDDARRIQAWADARVGADKVVRSPVARRLRADFETRCGANPPPDGAQAVPDLDTVLRLVLAGPDGGTAPRT